MPYLPELAWVIPGIPWINAEYGAHRTETASDPQQSFSRFGEFDLEFTSGSDECIVTTPMNTRARITDLVIRELVVEHTTTYLSVIPDQKHCGSSEEVTGCVRGRQMIESKQSLFDNFPILSHGQHERHIDFSMDVESSEDDARDREAAHECVEHPRFPVGRERSDQH